MNQFSVNDRVSIMWGRNTNTISGGVVKKITPKWVLLGQGAIRSQWVPLDLIKSVKVM